MTTDQPLNLYSKDTRIINFDPSGKKLLKYYRIDGEIFFAGRALLLKSLGLKSLPEGLQARLNTTSWVTLYTPQTLAEFIDAEQKPGIFWKKFFLNPGDDPESHPALEEIRKFYLDQIPPAKKKPSSPSSRPRPKPKAKTKPRKKGTGTKTTRKKPVPLMETIPVYNGSELTPYIIETPYGSFNVYWDQDDELWIDAYSLLVHLGYASPKQKLKSIKSVLKNYQNTPILYWKDYNGNLSIGKKGAVYVMNVLGNRVEQRKQSYTNWDLFKLFDEQRTSKSRLMGDIIQFLGLSSHWCTKVYECFLEDDLVYPVGAGYALYDEYERYYGRNVVKQRGENWKSYSISWSWKGFNLICTTLRNLTGLDLKPKTEK